MRTVKWLGFVAVVTGMSALAGWQIAIRWHPSPATYPIQGVDVSRHQGDIDWREIRSGGADFAFIKATEGGDWVDGRFAENWREAEAAGLRRGAYHFFTLCRPGREQAQNFIDTVPVDANALPPVVDLEFYGNCSVLADPETLRSELADFLELVEGHYGQRAILYVLEDFDARYAIIEHFDRTLWLRSLVTLPDYGGRDWTIWQASSFRHMDGVEGRIDWNVLAPEATLETLGDS
ncbi:glycoside hydrolase family 25 protein [Parasphingopyxis marina]|uniref:Glycoside hydrolase family 25 protein n=1 Tax=Parasphingopyxis marina TaxID=2761622 RepID=A0A842HZP7_9SPHN|nr:GH25 family lysozyme [Parasphingopyxis marina]MBC2777410.1 glycoside hydrolase family 25 protein [Parasphingopyxis marina]